MTQTDNPHHKHRWLILAILGIAQLMVVLDATIVNIALPSAQRALHFSNDNRQWVVTAYALSFGSLLLLGGRISDLFGRKWTFIGGLLGFAIVSAIGGMAQSFAVLAAARALQGAFGAILAPATLSLLTTTFTDPGERARAFGIYGAIAGGGAAIGLILGGVLTDALSWRWALYVNLVFAVPTALAGLALLTNVVPAVKPRVDIPGTLTAVTGLFALVYGLNKAETAGWGSTTTLALLAAAVVLLGAFVAIERRVARPLLPLRVVLDRQRGGSYLSIGIAGIGMFGAFLFLTYYLQQTLGYSPLRSGLAFLPMTGAIMLTATTATTKIVPRVGARPLVASGMLLAASGMALLTGLGLHSTYLGAVLPPLLLLGVGLGLIFAPAMSTATAGVEARDAGVASAMVNTAQQVGGSIGTALLSTLFTSAVSSAMGSTHPTAATIAGATMHGYTTAFWWSAGIFLLGALVCGLILPHGKGERDPAAEPVLAH